MYVNALNTHSRLLFLLTASSFTMVAWRMQRFFASSHLVSCTSPQTHQEKSLANFPSNQASGIQKIKVQFWVQEQGQHHQGHLKESGIRVLKMYKRSSYWLKTALLQMCPCVCVCIKSARASSAETVPAEGSAVHEWQQESSQVMQSSIMCIQKFGALHVCIQLWFRGKLQTWWPHDRSDHAARCPANVINTKLWHAETKSDA